VRILSPQGKPRKYAKNREQTIRLEHQIAGQTGQKGQTGPPASVAMWKLLVQNFVCVFHIHASTLPQPLGHPLSNQKKN
jgi:hypothetical protein